MTYTNSPLDNLTPAQLRDSWRLFETMFGLVSINIGGAEVTFGMLVEYHQDHPSRFGQHRECPACGHEEEHEEYQD